VNSLSPNMTCEFCRMTDHNKSHCTDPDVVSTQLEDICYISSIIANAYVRMNTPLTLMEDIQYWLSRIELYRLKYLFEFLKNNSDLNLIGNFDTTRHMIHIIPQMVFYDCGIDENAERITELPTEFYGTSTSPSAILDGLPEHTREVYLYPRLAMHFRTFSPPVDDYTNTYINEETNSYDDLRSPPFYGIDVLKLDEDCDTNDECPICYENLKNESFVRLNCDHTYCKSCIKECIDKKVFNCSMCRVPMITVYTKKPDILCYPTAYDEYYCL